MNEKGWTFGCKDCGSTELYVEHEYSITEVIVDFLECSCEEGVILFGKNYELAKKIRLW